MVTKGEFARFNNFFFCRHVFKKPPAAEVSKSVCMRKRVDICDLIMSYVYCLCPSFVSLSIHHTCFCSITEERLGLGTSYLVCRLVMTSRWPLLILMSEGQRSRSWWPCEVKNAFRSITEESLGRGTPYLVCRLAMPSRRPLLILRSVRLKSRSQWQWA